MKGIRMRQLRIERNINQEELGKILNISASSIGMYEIDKREPNDETKIKIADFFNVSIDYLLGRSDIKNPEQEINSEQLKIGIYTNDYRHITQEQKDKIKEYAEFILRNNRKEK